MSKIVPSLWFADNNCQDAIDFYTQVFPNSAIKSITHYPDSGLSPHFEGMAGKVINAEFTLNGQEFIGLDGGPYFRFSEAISFTITCKDQEEIDYYWDKLSAVPESEQCGWVKDSFGLSWQIIPSNLGQLQKTPAQIQALMGMKKIIIQDLIDAAD